MPTIYQITITALLSAFIVSVFTKTEARYYIRDYFVKAEILCIAKMLECDFCFSFWTCAVVAAISAVITQDLSWLITPILSANLTKYII